LQHRGTEDTEDLGKTLSTWQGLERLSQAQSSTGMQETEANGGHGECCPGSTSNLTSQEFGRSYQPLNI